MEFYYYKNGEKIGPVNFDELATLLYSGEIKAGDSIEVKGRNGSAGKVITIGSAFVRDESSGRLKLWFPKVPKTSITGDATDDIDEEFNPGEYIGKYMKEWNERLTASAAQSEVPESNPASANEEKPLSPAGEPKKPPFYLVLLDRSEFLERIGFFFNVLSFMTLCAAIVAGILATFKDGALAGFLSSLPVAATAVFLFVSGMLFLWLSALGRFLLEVFTTDDE